MKVPQQIRELFTRWRQVLVIGAISMVVAAALYFVLPRKYTARTVLYIPQPQMDPRLQALSGQIPTGLLGLSTGAQDARMISTIMQSRTLRDSLRSRFGDIKDLKTRSNPEGAITVEATHRDAETAAKIANATPDLINLLATQVGLNTHQRKQEFLRSQLSDAQARLGSIESRLVQFQQGSNAPELDEQARQTVAAAADLQARIAEKEIEVVQLRRTLTSDHPRLRAAEAELAAWRGQLNRLSTGRTGSNIYVPLQASAGLKAEAYRLLREFKTHEQLVVALTASLTQAEMDVRNNLPVINVIDAARVPERPAGPGLAAILVLSFLLGVLGGAAWILLTRWQNEQ